MKTQKKVTNTIKSKTKTEVIHKKNLSSNLKKTTKKLITNKKDAPFDKNYTNFNISYTKKPIISQKNTVITEKKDNFEKLESNKKIFDCDLIYKNEDNIGNLFLSDYVSAKNKNFRKEFNIKSIITIADQLKLNFEDDTEKINYFYIPALDLETYYITKHFEKCFNFIDDGLKNGNVLVHCAAGVSRSATIVIAYLMNKNKWSYKIAFEYAKEKRPALDPNDGFVRQLINFEKKINA